MDREQFKTLAAGKFALSKLEDTIDKNQMLAFIEGAVFAWDYLNKTKKKEEAQPVTQSNDALSDLQT